MSRIATFCILGLALSIFEARGADTYTIINKKVAKGDVTLITRELSEESKVAVEATTGLVELMVVEASAVLSGFRSPTSADPLACAEKV